MVTNGEPILLTGFDRDVQLQYDFNSRIFETFWLRRVYTNERSHILKSPGRCKPQEIRFGNNITVLLKACYHLRNFYKSPSFWAAVASGFGSMSAEVAKERASAFMDARKTFLHKGGPPDYISATTRAADDFMPFFESRSTQRPSASADDIWATAATFFSGMREKLVDSARITCEDDHPSYSAHTSARFAPQAGPRKRSPSPTSPDQPPSAKRRQFSDTPDRSDLSGPHARAPQSLPPLMTGKKVRGTARQDSCQTSSTTQDGTSPDVHFLQSAPERPVEFKIRGKAHIENFHSPSRDASDGTMEEHPSSYQQLRHAFMKLLDRVYILEQENKQREEARNAMDAKFASLEKRMEAFEAKPAQYDKTTLEMAKKPTSLDIQLQKTQMQLPDKSRAVQELKDRIESLEKQLDSKPQRPDGTQPFQEIQPMVESWEDRMITMESPTQCIASELTGMESKNAAEDKALVARVAALETRADTLDKHSFHKPAGQETLSMRLERQVTSLQTKLASVETRQEIDDKIGTLDGRINTLQEKITAVRKMVEGQSPLGDLLEKMQNHPTSESISEKIAQTEQALADMVEKRGKETLKHVEEYCNSARASTVCASSTRIDKLAEDLNTVTATLHDVQDTASRVQHDQPSINDPKALGRLDQLSSTVNGILEYEARLAMPDAVNDLFRRVECIEKVLRNLRDAYDG
ncbi:hypothetical protein VMCG_08087 [Cytospora schulzeri]|uniref:Uncharacterized protein n=1 Tax=Cytospora schulzeri TaxID=448051 RepID=A0A423VRS3_9PEZI|nr:hypothetical protein VMCG_08087 [Valsa malicola]